MIFKRGGGGSGSDGDGMSARKDKSSKTADPNGNRAERRAADQAAKKKG